jgi:hypothetical protein
MPLNALNLSWIRCKNQPSKPQLLDSEAGGAEGSRTPDLLIAERIGCPALRGGRVRLGPFLTWYYVGNECSAASLTEAQLEQIQRERVSPESHWTPGGWTA